MPKLKFAHIINAVSPADNEQLALVQELTFKALKAACAYTIGNPKVELLSAQYQNARPGLPEWIRPTSDLKECAANREQLNTSLRLPLLKEILSKLDECEDATHFIYSNLDICPMPYFYNSVASYIEQGYDALVINRRRVSGRYLAEKDLSLAYAEIGQSHTGYDCFVFSRELLGKFILKDIFIGAPPAGNDLFYNLFVFAKNPRLLTQKHLTFHAGMELYKEWGDAGVNAFNYQQFILLLKELRPQIDISKFPGSQEAFIIRHFKWLMNPTFHYPTMALAELKQLGKKKLKRRKERQGAKSRYLEWLIRYINFKD